MTAAAGLPPPQGSNKLRNKKSKRAKRRHCEPLVPENPSRDEAQYDESIRPDSRPANEKNATVESSVSLNPESVKVNEPQSQGSEPIESETPVQGEPHCESSVSLLPENPIVDEPQQEERYPHTVENPRQAEPQLDESIPLVPENSRQKASEAEERYPLDEATSRTDSLDDEEIVEVLAVGYRNYRLDVMIGLTPTRMSYLTAVLDTGASLSLMRESCLPMDWRKGKVEQPSPNMRILDANGKKVLPTAVVLLHVQVGRTVVKQRFLVVSNLSVPAILGCDFIDRELETISPRHRHIVMNDGERVHIGRRSPKQLAEAAVKPQPVSTRTRYTIRVSERTVLQPGTTTMVSVTTAAAGLQTLIPKASLMRDKGVQMANGVVNMRPYLPFGVEVTNFGSKKMIIPKNMVLGSVGGPPVSILSIDVHAAHLDQRGNSPSTEESASLVMDDSQPGESPAQTYQDSGKPPDCTKEVAKPSGDEKHSGSRPGPGFNPSSDDTTVETPAGDWQTQIRETLNELDQPHLIPQIIRMLEFHASMWHGELGEIAATNHRINLQQEAKPSRQAPYRAGHKSRELIAEQVRKMRDAGVIEPAQSEWASPVVIVTKKDGSPRFCVDYRKLNAVTIRDSYPLPRMDDCIDSLGDARIFTTLDCNSGYWQIPIAEEDRDKTAFISHAGAWQFKRMPFGLTNAPATFQRALDILLAGVKWQFCLVYLDDVIIFSKEEEEHIRHVDHVLTVLRQAGVTLKLRKSEFFRKSVNYLGHTIRPGRLEILESGTEALREAKFPKNQTQLKSYLGSCNVYRRFVKHFAKVAAPLTDLLKKGLPFQLEPPDQEQLESFNRLRDALLNPPVLRLPKPDVPYVLDVDASKAQLGCTLLQSQEDDMLHPVGYWSRTMTDAQRNYTTTEKECLAVFWAITLLRPYLERTRFTIRTDHNSLTWILSITPSEGRLARWRLRLAEFDFDVQYRPGVKNLVPDALSRIETTGTDDRPLDEEIPTFLITSEEADNRPEMDMYPEDWDVVPCYVSPTDFVVEPITVQEWLHEQSLDSLCQELQAQVDANKTDRYKINEQGVLQRVHPVNTQTQIVVPERLRSRVLLSHHNAAVAGHPGVRRMYETLRKGYWWPTMIVSVYATVRACETCSRDRVQLVRHTNTLKLFPAKRPLDDVAIDILGPLPKTTRGNLYIVVIMDRYSKLCRLESLSNVRASTLAKAFVESWVFTYGPPRTLLSDNGKQFISKLFQDTCRVFGIANKYTTTYHPQANGQVERFNRTLASMLRNYVADDQAHWDEYLPAMAYAYNRCVHRATNTTPFELILTRPPPALGTAAIRQEGHSRAWSRDQWNKSLKQAYAKTNKSLLRVQERYKRDFDKSVSSPNRYLRAGDPVFVDFSESSKEDSVLGRARNKLDFKTFGPYTVVHNFGHSLDIEIDGIPERVSSDRVRPAPKPTAVDDAVPPLSRKESAPSEKGPARSGLNNVTSTSPQPLSQDNGQARSMASSLPTDTPSHVRMNTQDAGRREPSADASPVPTDTPSHVRMNTQDAGRQGKAEEDHPEWVIDKLMTEGIDPLTGERYFKVRWYNFGPEADTWEPEADLPAPLVARCRRRLAAKQSQLIELQDQQTGGTRINQKSGPTRAASPKNPTRPTSKLTNKNRTAKKVQFSSMPRVHS